MAKQSLDSSKPSNEKALASGKITCPLPNDAVAPTFSAKGTYSGSFSGGGVNVACVVQYNGDSRTALGQVDSQLNWQVQFSDIPLTGSDMAHVTAMLGATFTNDTGGYLASYGPFAITIQLQGKTCT